jgi:CBS domain-containing protein
VRCLCLSVLSDIKLISLGIMAQELHISSQDSTSGCRRSRLEFPPERQNTMKVQDVMTYGVQTCGPETDLADAAMRMWRGDCGILPVLAGKGNPL